MTLLRLPCVSGLTVGHVRRSSASLQDQSGGVAQLAKRKLVGLFNAAPEGRQGAWSGGAES